VTFADAVAVHVEPVAAAWGRRRAARGPAQRTRRSAARSCALA
jgi:hypothetical protein